MRIEGKRVWLGGQFLPAQLWIEEGVIRQVLPYGAERADADCGEKMVLPGFIDLHTHGAYGYDAGDGDPQGLREWLRRVPEEGVTALLATTVTQSPSRLERSLRGIAEAAEAGRGGGTAVSAGAELLGIHLEGPFIDRAYCGAQPPEAAAEADIMRFECCQQAAGGLIRYITLAPEHDPDFTLTRYCSARGIVVSLGHSGAGYEQALLAAANGASSMTHVYNAMSPFHHRRPGLTGAALRLRELYGEVIADGRHSDLAALSIFFQAKGAERALLVSDSLRVKRCLAPGKPDLGGRPIEVGEDGLARLAGCDTIAGSTLAINEGLRLLIEEAGVSREAAINSCTLNPARCFGLEARKGSLRAGRDADLVVLDRDYRVEAAYCRGRLAYPAFDGFDQEGGGPKHL